MTVATDDRPSKIASNAAATSADRFITIKGDWAHFKLIQKGCEQNSGTRLFYLDGTIEILMTGRSHELFSHLIGNLLSFFLACQGIDFFPFGTADQEKEGIAASQPDQSYCFGTVKPIPDLSIEVVFTSGGVAKLQRYKAIGVPEVWFWEDGTLTGSAIMCRMKNNRLALEALPEVSTHQRLFFSVLYKMALPTHALSPAW